VVFDKSEKTFRTEMYPDYKRIGPIRVAQQLYHSERCTHSTCPAWQAGFRPMTDRDSYTRLACEAGHRHHRVVRQGPDAAQNDCVVM
jgi:hypothetical protein